MTETGVILRASRILHAVADAGVTGARLVDITDWTGLSRPTVHRILKDLASVGMVTQDEESSRYSLGDAIVRLALAAPRPDWDLVAMRGIAQELADEVGDTVYVSTRDIDGVRYLVRAEGSFPVRALMVNVGDVKPFTSSYSGLALLASASDDQVNRAMAAHLTDAPEGWWDSHATEQQMRAQMAHVRAEGYCGGPGLVIPEVSGMAAPVPTPRGIARFAVSVSAVDYRLGDSRIAELAPRLLEAARRLGDLTNPATTTPPMTPARTHQLETP